MGDVSGHGLDAAIQALRLKDLLQAAVMAGIRLADALALANYRRLGDLDDEEVVELGAPREVALLHERLDARRPVPLRDRIAAVEFILPASSAG